MRNFRDWQDESVLRSPDFRGYHCSNHDIPRGRIEPRYASHSFRELLDSLPNELRMRAMRYGWIDRDFESGHGSDPSIWSDEDTAWAQQVAAFLWENDIRWLFVSHDQPYGDNGGSVSRQRGWSYGGKCFYVLLPERDVIADIYDPHEINATMLVYHASRPPRLVPIPS